MSQVEDATRAAAIINVAMANGMFPEGRMPADDSDKIIEAEKLIVLAKQADEIAKAIGKANVPSYPAIEEILFEAHVTVGTGQQPDPPAPEPAPTAAPAHRPSAEEIGEALPVAPEPVAQAPAEPFDDPKEHEVWLDSEGNQWTVMRYGGGPQCEVRSASGDQTIVPAGFLKQRHSLAPEPQVQPTPEPPQEQPSAPPAPSAQPEQPSSSSPSASPSSETEQHAPEQMSSEPSGSASPAPSSPSLPPSSSSTPPSSPDVPATAPVEDDEGDDRYEEILARTEANWLPSAMPVPMDLEQPPTAMPDDLTVISDIMARKYHSQFNALAARARYLRGLDAARARECDRARKLYLKPAMRTARGELGKTATLEEVKALAEEDENVALWEARRIKHAERADAYGEFVHIYTENVTVLSRDYTMREKEQAGS